MNLFQDVYISIFNKIFELTGRVSPRVREIANTICLVILVLVVFTRALLKSVGIISMGIHDITVIGIILTAMICILSIEKPLERVAWNKWIYIPYFMAAVCMALMSIDHEVGVGFRSYPFILLFLFPALYLVWGNSDKYEKYIDTIAVTLAITGVAIVVFFAMYAPLNGNTFSGPRYLAVCSNPNAVSVLMIVPIAAALYLAQKQKKLMPLYAIISGMCCTIVMLTQSRTAILVVITQLIVWAIIVLRTSEKGKIIKNAVIAAVTIVIVIASGMCMSMVMESNILAVGDLGKQLPRPEPVVAEAPVAEESGTVNAADEQNIETPTRFDTEGKDINQISNNRIALWKWHIDRLHVRGNSCDNREVYLEGSPVPMEDAHNIILEIAYRYGIFSGIFFAIFFIVAVFIVVRNIITGNLKPTSMFVYLIMVAFAYESMLDVIVLPYRFGVALIAYILLIEIFEDAKPIKKANRG